jgi:chemotaxis protein MotB
MSSARLRLAARACGACAGLLALLLAAGCVSRGRYDEAVAERDALRAEKARLATTSASLDAERVALLEQMEDLRQEHENLEVDLAKLRKKEAELSQSLAARQAELAARNEELAKLKGTYEGLVSDLQAEVAAGQIEIQQLRDGLQLNMAQEVLFASGSAEVGKSGAEVLAKVAERVRQVPYRVVVQGHTDRVPIASERYPTNWELAGARAARVVRILAERGVPPERLSAVSFGEHAPRADNGTEAGRAKNRRIEITLSPLPDAPQAAARAPAPAKPAAATGPALPAAPAP